jgi:hypothetical protein
MSGVIMKVNQTKVLSRRQEQSYVSAFRKRIIASLVVLNIRAYLIERRGSSEARFGGG